MSEGEGESRWRRGSFKGQKVWIQVDGDGMPDARGGRVAVRYSDKAGTKIYKAGASRVESVEGPVLALPPGVDADAGGESTSSSSSPAARSSGRGSGFGSAGTRTAAQSAAAAEAAGRLIASLPAGTHIAFTDGSCKGNPGPAGSGVSLRLADGRRADASRSLGVATNNVGELTAIEVALQLLDEAEVPATDRVAVLTDSAYAFGVLAKGWKAKANTELIGEIRAALKRRKGVELHWVAGHTGVEGNEAADKLANDGVAGRSITRWSGPPA